MPSMTSGYETPCSPAGPLFDSASLRCGAMLGFTDWLDDRA